MEDRYYLPKIEEFYVGFEYEHILKDNFTKCAILCYPDIEDVYYDIPLNKIRVKYLDKEDIESFGFKQHEKLKYQYYKDHFMFVKLHIDNQYSIEDLTDNQCIFYGVIKNKSELKKLLIQLEIINE